MKHTAARKIDWTTAPVQLTWHKNWGAGNWATKSEHYGFIATNWGHPGYWTLTVYRLDDVAGLKLNGDAIDSDTFGSLQDCKAVAAHYPAPDAPYRGWEKMTEAVRDGLDWITNQQWGEWK